MSDEKPIIIPTFIVDLQGSSQAGALEPVAYRTSIGDLYFLWLGPVGFIGGTSPYLDFFLENFYVHRVNWVQ